MGLTLLDTIELPALPPKSNLYLAFGTTQAAIMCDFDASNTRTYMVNIGYGLYYDQASYNANLQPITINSLTINANSATISNISNLLFTSAGSYYGNVYNDGIDN